jgi:fumarylacetoacetase
LTAYGVFSRPGAHRRVGFRSGELVVDLGPLGAEFEQPSLNAFMAGGPDVWAATSDRARELLERGDGVHALAAVDVHMPFEVADYVDFFSSREHATNMGRMFRPDTEALLPNWLHLPVGYHGRAGTVVPSGTPIVRPRGQAKPPEAAAPVFGASRRLDIELELGFVIGTPSALGERVPLAETLDHVFGVVLVNDWSARDIQAWEYQPLGPFLGKSFATSISAWVVPLSELEPLRVPLPPQDPEPLPYLRAEPWAYELALEVELNGGVVSRTSARHLYWSIEQQVAHLTVNGASLRSGDLLASGTISGPGASERGSLIELTWNGAEPLRLSDGSERTFLEDGDEVVLRAPELGLEVSGRIEPAPAA